MSTRSTSETTLARSFTVSGYGLHTGRRAQVTVAPAPPGHGIRFRAAERPEASVGLSWENRVSSRMNTALALPDGSRLRTVEHLVASLSAFEVDNALVTVQGREIPIFDGSARRWCACLSEAGLERQSAPRRLIRVTQPVQVALGARFMRVEPAPETELDITCEQFADAAVLRWRGRPTRDVFVRELAGSRSSGPAMRAVRIGLGERFRRGASMVAETGRARAGRIGDAPNRRREDLPADPVPGIAERLPFPADEPVLRGALPGRVAIWIGPWVLGGKRFPDELVRHVALDLIGDLRLAGAPLLGRIVAHQPTHRLTYAFVATLMQSPGAWAMD